jgi:hypothetical protein
VEPERPTPKSRSLVCWLLSAPLIICGALLGIAFIVKWQAVAAAHRYCREKGGLVVNELMPNDIILGEFKTNGAPGLTGFGQVIANDQPPLAQLDAIDGYQLQQIKRKPRGRALAVLLESRPIYDISLDDRSKAGANMVPWDDKSPMIIAGPDSPFCRVAIKIEMKQARKILGLNNLDSRFRFCRPDEQDYNKLYIRNINLYNRLRVSLFEGYIYFQGWRVYHWGSEEPAATMTKIGVEPVSEKLIMPIALRGVDPEFAGNVCTVPELAETTKGAADPSFLPKRNDPFIIGRTMISGNSGYAYPGKKHDD